MGLETATYINGLVVTNPLGTDPKSAGDDHLRLLKTVIKNTFPNLTGAVTPTQAELNYVAGVTSAIQTQLNAKQATITGAATSIVSSNLAVSMALVSDASGKVAAHGTVSSTELGYLDGVTSAIQTQLDAKQATITGAATTIVSSNLTASRALVSDGTGKVAVSLVTSTELALLDGKTGTLATLEASQSWAAQQVPFDGTLTDGVTINWNGNTNGQVVSVTLAGNRTLAAPTNVLENAVYVLRVSQDATGGRTLTWDAVFKFPGGVDPVLSSGASQIDIFSFIGGAGGVLYCVGAAKGLA